MPSFLRPLLFAILTVHALMLLAGAAFGEDKLPTDAEKLVAAFDADAAKMRAETEKAIEKKAATLATALQKAQDAATKKGDLEGAMAIKAKIAALSGKGADKPAAASVQDLKRVMVGTFSYAFPNGHKGKLNVKGSNAVDVLSNTQGEVMVVDNKLTIAWANNTQWIVGNEGETLTVQASDGVSKLATEEAPAKR